MADFTSVSTNFLQQVSTTLFTGLRDEPDLLADLADYHIELDDEVAQGLALLDELRTAIGEQEGEAAEAVHATAASRAALAALRVLHARHRKLGRAAHPRGSAGYTALGLAGEVPRAEYPFLAHTEAFYTALDAHPDLYAGIRGISKKTIQDALARIAHARTLETEQDREEGEAQEATVRRQVAEASLRALSADVAAAIEDAYHDRPQRRERLGLFQRGSTHR